MTVRPRVITNITNTTEHVQQFSTDSEHKLSTVATTISCNTTTCQLSNCNLCICDIDLILTSVTAFPDGTTDQH